MEPDPAGAVEGSFKHLSDRFSGNARVMVSSGKAYVKAMQGALAASKTFIEALIKLSRQGQNEPGPEIGSALGEVADFQAEVHTQQVELLRIFYAEFLTPLESNVEKDERILNTEYRRFVNENQLHLGAIQRAASRVKKERKKMKGSSATLDREHKYHQNLQEEERRYDKFLDDARTYITIQCKQRYGFILERQGRLLKQLLDNQRRNTEILERSLDRWMNIARQRDSVQPTRESRPEPKVYINGGSKTVDLRRPASVMVEPNIKPFQIDSEDTNSLVGSSTLKSESRGRRNSLQQSSRSGSDSKTTNGSSGGVQNNSNGDTDYQDHNRPSIDNGSRPFTESPPKAYVAHALHSHLSSSDDQLSFVEGDPIKVTPGTAEKGWQYGTNMRTLKSGWFPIAFTDAEAAKDFHESDSSFQDDSDEAPPPIPARKFVPPPIPERRFGDTLTRRIPGHMSEPPPPPLPPQGGGLSPGAPSLQSSADSGFDNDTSAPYPPKQEEPVSSRPTAAQLRSVKLRPVQSSRSSLTSYHSESISFA